MKGAYKSNPYSSNVKKAVPVESWWEKKRKELGDIEVDLLYHSGESAKGEFCFTLTATEITTDWTELYAVKNKAMIWVVKGMRAIIRNMRVTVKRIHSDNGTEFLNQYMYKVQEVKSLS